MPTLPMFWRASIAWPSVNLAWPAGGVRKNPRRGVRVRQEESMTAIATEPATQVQQWLSSFEEALARPDTAAAAGLFLETSFWRALVAFTWNLKTVEGP